MNYSPGRPPTIPAECAECPIRELTVCQPLRDCELQTVQSFKTCDRILPAKSPLYHQGEVCTELYNLLDGWVVLYRVLESGAYHILDFALPGSFVGYQSPLDQPMQHGAYCLTNAAVCVFPRQRFHDLLEQKPRLAVRLAVMGARDMSTAHGHLTNIASRTAPARVAHLLFDLYSRLVSHGLVKDGEEVEIPLTQAHIADALGLTSVHISHTLKRLRAQGVLVFSNGRLQILNPRGLKRTGWSKESWMV